MNMNVDVTFIGNKKPDIIHRVLVTDGQKWWRESCRAVDEEPFETEAAALDAVAEGRYRRCKRCWPEVAA